MKVVFDTVFYLLFFITAGEIIYYDGKYKTIPFGIVLLNLTALIYLTSPIFYIAYAFLLYCKIKDTPIDIIYIFILCYLLLIGNSYDKIFSVLMCLIFTIATPWEEREISYMIPLEVSIATIFLTKG